MITNIGINIDICTWKKHIAASGIAETKVTLFFVPSERKLMNAQKSSAMIRSGSVFCAPQRTIGESAASAVATVLYTGLNFILVHTNHTLAISKRYATELTPSIPLKPNTMENSARSAG